MEKRENNFVTFHNKKVKERTDELDRQIAVERDASRLE